jgi:ABC-2 type transport system permease protein
MKTTIVLKREYLTRVKKKSFIIMTFLSPLIMAAVIIGYFYIIFAEDTDDKRIGIVDESMVIFESIKNTDHLSFELLAGKEMNQVKKDFGTSGYYAILYIPANILSSERVQLFSDIQPSQAVIMYIQNSIKTYIEDKKIIDEGISRETLQGLKVNLYLDTIKWTPDGQEVKSSTGIAMAIGYIAGLLIYMFIFMYGVQVMRGVIEEKTNRIIEVIISSVKPFQLMMGKITGIALVGVTQFVMWVILIVFFTWIGLMFIAPEYNAAELMQTPQLEQVTAGQPIVSDVAVQTGEGNDQYHEMIRGALESVNFLEIAVVFLIYFLGGYLLYASLFAAVGSAVDNETDTQQFMFPITIPLILGIFVMANAIQNPDGSFAFWFSIIPFTSPIVMMARIPFGVPYSELYLSIFLLLITFIATTWLAGKIYRTGILMYGKKITYSELLKWIRHRG